MGPIMQTIKIKTTDKGEFHWEQYLLQKQERRLNRVLSDLDVNPWKKRIVIQLFKSKCIPTRTDSSKGNIEWILILLLSLHSI